MNILRFFRRKRVQATTAVMPTTNTDLDVIYGILNNVDSASNATLRWADRTLEAMEHTSEVLDLGMIIFWELARRNANA